MAEITIWLEFSQNILQSVLILTMNQNIGYTIWTTSYVQTFMPLIATKAQQCVQFQHIGWALSMLVMSKLCKHRSSNRAYEANITEDRFLNCTNGNFASTCCGVERTLTRNFLDIKLFLLLQILSTLCKLCVLSTWIYFRPLWSSKFFCKQLIA